jgi:hypothetical protein
VCNKRGPQTFGTDKRLTLVQQLNLMQHCANSPPGRPKPGCLRVVWKSVVNGRVLVSETL